MLTSNCCWFILTAGKSSVLLDVKPWDDETDMKKLEETVRSVQMEGLLWGACMFLSPFILRYVHAPLEMNMSALGHLYARPSACLYFVHTSHGAGGQLDIFLSKMLSISCTG